MVYREDPGPRELNPRAPTPASSPSAPPSSQPRKVHPSPLLTAGCTDRRRLLLYGELKPACPLTPGKLTLCTTVVSTKEVLPPTPDPGVPVADRYTPCLDSLQLGKKMHANRTVEHLMCCTVHVFVPCVHPLFLQLGKLHANRTVEQLMYMRFSGRLLRGLRRGVPTPLCLFPCFLSFCVCPCSPAARQAARQQDGGATDVHAFLRGRLLRGLRRGVPTPLCLFPCFLSFCVCPLFPCQLGKLHANRTVEN